MLANRRNLLFRVSIVINIAVLFYAAMHLSGSPAPGVDWVPITVDGSERNAEFRYMNQELRNDTEIRQDIRIESSVRNIEESTSQKTPSTLPTTNKSLSSTVSLAEIDRRANTFPLETEATNETEAERYIRHIDDEIVNEDIINDFTRERLQELLECNERDYASQNSQKGDYWVLKNYVRADHGPIACHDSITYTTHAGYEFLDNVEPLVKRWMGPVSLAIHAPGSDFAPTVESIRYLRECTESQLVRQFVTFHIFFSSKHIPSNIPDPEKLQATTYKCPPKAPFVNVNASTTYKKTKNLLYPVNVARNVAREAALTHFILPSDIELYPSPNLIPRFLNMIARNKKPLSTSAKPRVFPISIFEVDAKVQVPSTKTELQSMLTNKTAIPFHKFVCPICHNIPQGQQWMNAAETMQMDVFYVGKRRGKFAHWEPIYIGTHHDPYYDERLSWEGKQDKMTQGYILCVKDYDFMILNNAFMIHKPGIKRYVKNPKRDKIAGRQSSFVKNTIMPELKKLFGTKTGCSV